MAWIEASAAGGGSTGGGNTIMVTCSESFAGLPITCTNGLTTKTLNCPSTAPYVIQFTDIVADEWTISGTIDGTTYSTTVEVGDIFTTVLESGFEWQTWVDLSQNYHSADYNSLAEVFADEGALHELMTIHACCDYLIGAVSDDINTIDDFCANDTAMKWIGLRDYVCDGLTAISGVEAKFLASDYWERYLKDHVPTMTSNTAPYGVTNASSELTSGGDVYYSWRAFNGTNISGSDCWHSQTGADSWIEVDFPTPICVKKVVLRNRNATVPGPRPISTFKIKGSNDGTTWVDITDTLTNSDTSANAMSEYAINNSTYYMKLRLSVVSVVDTYAAIGQLQFYGRSLDISVPTMTSNTAPYGEAFSDYSGVNAYYAFDNSTSTLSSAQVNGRIGYKFTDKMCVKKVLLRNRERSNGNVLTFKIQGSNDDTWHDLTETLTNKKADTANAVTMYDVPSSEQYHDIALQVLTIYTDNVGSVSNLQFYGVDYSEREFEPNSGKKWLYDHGLELEPIDIVTEAVTKGTDNIKVERTGSAAARWKIDQDLTNYSLARAKVDGFYQDTTFLNVTDSNNQDISYIAITSTNAPNNIALDISNIDGNVRIGMQSNVSGAYNTTTELWLEQ